MKRSCVAFFIAVASVILYFLLSQDPTPPPPPYLPLDPSKPIPHIAIGGAGISGLTLAGILGKSIGHRAKITVFERASAERDQGYGLDLDEHGQEALARAGVYNKYWEISRPRSDSMALFDIKGGDPLYIHFRPQFLQEWLPAFFAARPETNREGLRDLLLESFENNDNVNVLYDTPIVDMKKVGEKAELIGQEGKSLGVFDLVIDGTGVHSRLRKYRVDDPQGKHRTGELCIHGVINSPEEKFDQELLDRFGCHGSIISAGQGYQLLMQRFGKNAQDNRTSFFYIIPSNEEEVFSAMGIDKPSSRRQGIMTGERLEKVKQFILSDMGDRFEKMFDSAVLALDRVTVGSFLTHGMDTELKEDVDAPLVCIGDAQRNCGLGAGGILAMRDCLELGTLLRDPAVFDQTGIKDWDKIRAAEQDMIARKKETHEEMLDTRLKMIERREDGDLSLSWDLLFGGEDDWTKSIGSAVLPHVARYMVAWYKSDLEKGQAGSTSESPIYPSVAEVWEKMKEEGDAAYTRSAEDTSFYRKFF